MKEFGDGEIEFSYYDIEVFERACMNRGIMLRELLEKGRQFPEVLVFAGKEVDRAETLGRWLRKLLIRMDTPDRAVIGTIQLSSIALVDAMEQEVEDGI